MTRRWSPPRAVRRGALAVSLGLLVTVLTTIPDACAAGDRGAAAPAAGGVVDSALPIAVLLERFRRATPETLTTLTGGADTPERLARTLLSAVAAHDTAGVRALVLSRAEFAWLYYPHTRFVAPPYELGPELAWLTHAAESGKGERRLLARFGGHALGFVALDCPGSITDEGPNRVIGGCEMRFTDGAESPRPLRLFGALLYRDGRYKFLSYVNDL